MLRRESKSSAGMQRRRQRGLSLVEMMISLTVGLVILSGAIGLYASMVKSQSDNLAMTRLNQEMRAAMDLVVRDVRRAGYWAWAGAAANPNATVKLSAAGGSATVTALLSAAPFTTFGADLVGLKLASSVGLGTFTGYTSGSVAQLNVTRNFTVTTLDNGAWLILNPFSEDKDDLQLPAAGCVTYSYDRDADGLVDDEERFGFRLRSGNLEMRTSTAAANADDCDQGTWTAVNTSRITITGLTLSLAGSRCVNTTTGATGTGATCTSGTNGDILVQERELNITLTARLTSDSGVARTLQETVRVRNDKVKVQ